MLRNFLLLDEEQLNKYISQIENGLRRVSSRTLSKEKGGSGEFDAKLLRLGLKGTVVDGESIDYADDGPARFERLLALVSGDEEEFGWRDVQENGDALANLRPGHLLAFGAEIYESDVSRLSNPAGLLSMLPLVRSIGKLPGQNDAGALQDALGGGVLEAIESFGSAMRGQAIVQGEILDTDWQFVSVVPGSRDLEGAAYVVGKVSKVWGAGEWRMLPGLPMFSQMPREQRRELERKGPSDSDRMMWMEGPAVELDLLAVYR